MRALSLETLVAEAECRALVLRSAEAVDAQDYAGFADCFCPDGELVRPDGSVLQGQAAIVQAYRARNPDRLTQHLLCNHRVEVDAATQTALSCCKVLLWSGQHSAQVTPQGRLADALTQVGEFVDTLEHSAAGWRIRRRDAVFILHKP